MGKGARGGSAADRCAGTGRARTDLTAALDLRRALLRPPLLYAAGDAVSVRVPGSLASFLKAESAILDEVRTRLGVEVRLLPDDAVPPGSFEILAG